MIEGHLGGVHSVSFSFDGSMLASKSHDNTIRIWRCNDWGKNVAVLQEDVFQGSYLWQSNLAFHPNSLILATLFDNDTGVHIWNVGSHLLDIQKEDTSYYVTAKIVPSGRVWSRKNRTGLEAGPRRIQRTRFYPRSAILGH